jgi:peptide deformylase
VHNNLIYYPNPSLSVTSLPINLEIEVIEPLQKLISDMKQIMHERNGIGLAAIQIGIPQRLMVMQYGEEDIVLINPAIETFTRIKKGMEGCLSLPGICGEVERAEEVLVSYQNLDGTWVKNREFLGINGRCVGHEIDHMNGKLFIEKMPSHKRFFLKRQLQALKDKYEQENIPKI